MYVVIAECTEMYGHLRTGSKNGEVGDDLHDRKRPKSDIAVAAPTVRGCRAESWS